ncbi:MAG TPA: hypothetical protein VE710_14300 [Candidatus Bathyarchaeia archaeon]|nr:hypothetical protein [Candidatus Bathyarchaeia archaeon]
MVLAQNSRELVSRCYEQINGFVEKEELKRAFVTYVFKDYQEEVVSIYGLEAFHEHLETIQLSNCRKDFDAAVEEWYRSECGDEQEGIYYHDILFSLVRETIVTYQPSSKEDLLRDLTKLMTSPNGFVCRWKSELQRSLHSYYQYLMRLGIRSYHDIEALVDMWLIEYPNSFDKTQQKLFAKPVRRGRPNNAELSLLLEKAYEWKPSLTALEKERIRKIYYYHRKSMSTLDMIEKFKHYVMAKTEQKMESKSSRLAN